MLRIPRGPATQPLEKKVPAPQSGERRERKRSLLLVTRSLAVISEFALNSC